MKRLLVTLAALAGLGAMAAGAQAADGNAQAGKRKVATCIGCHGIAGNYKATYPEVYNVPMIGGQGAKYIEAALHAYAKGDRTHPTMRGVAGALSDQDMADVAAYYSSMK